MVVEISSQHRDRRAERDFPRLEKVNRGQDWPLGAVAKSQITNEEIAISEPERFRHLYIVGKTGSGKSNLMKSLALHDICAGKAVVYFDPHGDDADDLIDAIPRRFAEKCCFLDLADVAHPVAFNPLDRIPLERCATVASTLTEGFRDIWGDAWSERMSWFLYNGLALLAEHGATLADLRPLYFNERFRATFTRTIQNAITREFWLHEFPSYPENYRREAPGAILNRIGQLISSPYCNAVLSRRHSSLQFDQLVDRNYIVIVTLAKGLIGNTAASLMGSILISHLRSVIMARQENRDPVAIYIDEFQSFATLSLAQLLAESRKYGAQLVLGHQYLSQLRSEIRGAILGNAGTMISFRVGAEDAGILAPDFDLSSTTALTDLQPFRAYLKRGIQATRIVTTPFDYSNGHRGDNMRASRLRFSS